MGFLTYCMVGLGCKENYRNTAIAFTKSEGIDNLSYWIMLKTVFGKHLDKGPIWL